MVDEINIFDDQDLYAAYRYVIPVVVVGDGTPIPAPASMDVAYLRAALEGAQVAAGAPTAPAPAMPLQGPGVASVATMPGPASAAAAPPARADSSTAAALR